VADTLTERRTASTILPGGWLPALLLANLAGQVGIVLTGGLVRLTGSGLGCPTWPECTAGSYTPVVNQPQGWHTYVEYGNRLLTFVLVGLSAAALVAVVLAIRDPAGRVRPEARRRLLALGAVPVLGVVAQAVIGGLTVLTGLSPGVVAVHFGVSMALIAGSTWLYLTGRGEPSPSPAPGPGPVSGAGPVRREVRVLMVAVCAVAAMVLALGTVVTGSGPHSGDAETPNRFGFDPRTVSWLHADAVWLFVGLVVALALSLRLIDGPPTARRRAVLLLGVTLLQGAIGYLQYLTGLPILAVAAHLLGASLLVVAVTATAYAVLGQRPTSVAKGSNGSIATATNNRVR
jgi:cytochrome c oxidase assembly protein subunit 15